MDTSRTINSSANYCHLSVASRSVYSSWEDKKNVAFGMFVSDILDKRADLGKYMWDTYKSSLIAHEQTIVSL